MEEYQTLGELFSRGLHKEARPIAATDVIAPCDGVVASCGEVEAGRLYQIKNIEYSLGDLLLNQKLAEGFYGGQYVTIYLSPKDYHRVHSPVAGVLTRAHHIPGRLFPVMPLVAVRVPSLLTRNERVVFQLQSKFGPVLVIMIAALGVGNIRMLTDETSGVLFDSNPNAAELAVAIQKGQELAAFELGSTVVMVFEKGVTKFDPSLVGSRWVTGQTIGGW